MYRDGKKGEEYFEKFLKRRKLEYYKIKQPFDFLVEGKYVEVKSAKLYIKQNGHKLEHGRYECWSKKQLQNIRKLNPWICLLIQHNNDFIIQGFLKGEYIKMKENTTNKRMSLVVAQRSEIKTTKQFLKYIRGKK